MPTPTGYTSTHTCAELDAAINAVGYKYEKPNTGIPKTDLASAVQTSLGKADTALQSYTETDPVFAASVAADITNSDISNWNSKTSNIGTITGINMNGASKGTSGVVDLGTVITAHQDISGKADKTATVTKVSFNSFNQITYTINGGLYIAGSVFERNQSIGYTLSSVGWYRIGEFMNTMNKGNACFLLVRRAFNSNNCESYMFAITAHYSGGITISQLAGHYNNHLFDKIRVDYVNNTSTKPQIDIHISTVSNGNDYAFTIIGSANLFSSATFNPTTIGTQYEYENLNGMGTSRDFKANGSITCTTLTQTSDEKLKNKIGDININVEDIANAPNLTFKWKKGQDTDTLYGGTYAQYWEKITPYYVHGEESDKSLEYSPLAVSCSIQLAKEIVTLKEENAQLKKELTEIKEMVNKLIK